MSIQSSNENLCAADEADSPLVMVSRRGKEWFQSKSLICRWIQSCIQRIHVCPSPDWSRADRGG